MKLNILLYAPMMAVVLQDCQCAVPGTFFWKPRMAIDLRASDKPKDSKYKVHEPSLYNIRAGRVVLINGFSLGTTMVAVATVGMRRRPKFPQMDVTSADFYTNAYRWAMRAWSLIPEWLGGDKKYPVSHQVWRKRFQNMDDTVPQWLRSLLFYVDDWDREEWSKRRFNIYAKSSFDKHLRYPSSNSSAEDFASFRNTKETAENLDYSVEETAATRSKHWG